MIPVSEPSLDGRELAHVEKCLRSGWITGGPYVRMFEEQWADFCGRRHAVAVSSGTAALHVAVAALDLGPGDEVILPSFTIISCATAVVAAGATPVLVDAGVGDWCIDVTQIDQRITPRTRAVMPVHAYGHPADMDRVRSRGAAHDLLVIEDAAEAHGAEYRTEEGGEPRWRRCGSFGDISCFSFYANKLVTTGEGGMVLTDDADLADRARSLSNLFFDQRRRFHHEEIGFNYRLTDVQAAIGVAQLERIEERINRKRWLADAYGNLLSDLEGLQLPVRQPYAHPVCWMYGIVLDDSFGPAAAVAESLLVRGVETRPFFLGLHEQPALRKRGLFGGESYPVTERLSRQGFYLPSGLTLTEEQVEYVATALRQTLA